MGISGGEFKQQLIANFVKSEEERFGLTSRLTSLYNAQALYKKRVNILPNWNRTSGARAATASGNLPMKCCWKLQEVRVAENQNIGNVRILEDAPSSSKGIESQKNHSSLRNVLAIHTCYSDCIYFRSKRHIHQNPQRSKGVICHY